MKEFYYQNIIICIAIEEILNTEKKWYKIIKNENVIYKQPVLF